MKRLLLLLAAAVTLQGETFCNPAAFQDIWRLDINISQASESDTRITILDLSGTKPSSASVGQLTYSAKEVPALLIYWTKWATNDAGVYAPTCTINVKAYDLVERSSVPLGTVLSEFTLTYDAGNGQLSGTVKYTMKSEPKSELSTGWTLIQNGTVKGYSISSILQP